jgi:hypothetical protein
MQIFHTLVFIIALPYSIAGYAQLFNDNDLKKQVTPSNIQVPLTKEKHLLPDAMPSPNRPPSPIKYYCVESKAYYPEVIRCPSPWKIEE